MKPQAQGDSLVANANVAAVRDRRAAIKARDTWWPTIFSGPVANRAIGILVAYEWIHPNHVTVSGMLAALLASFYFSRGSYADLVIGAVLIQIVFILDCADGQLARYRGLTSPFGAVLDRVFDRWKQFLFPMSLAYGAARYSPAAGVWVAGSVAAFGSLLVELYAQQYDLLRGNSGDGRVPANSKPFPIPLRLLDLPFVRRFCGDHYFLISLFCLLDQVPLLLLLLAAFAGVQMLFRPLYYLELLRRIHGVWPWRVEKPLAK